MSLVEAILRDKKNVTACCAYCDREYDAGGYYVGVPAVLGAGGVERIIELKLNAEEKTAFTRSLKHVKELVGKVDKILD